LLHDAVGQPLIELKRKANELCVTQI